MSKKKFHGVVPAMATSDGRRAELKAVVERIALEERRERRIANSA